MRFGNDPVWRAKREAALKRINEANKRRLSRDPNAPAPAPKERPPRLHAMGLDKRTGTYYVRVPTSAGRTHRVSTGESDYRRALEVVDASGVQKLSILARAKCLTADVAQALIAGHNTTCSQIIRAWAHNMKIDVSPETAFKYSGIMRKLFANLGCENKSLGVVTRQDLYAFVNDPALKEKTREYRLAAVRSFYRHAAGYGHVVGNIASTVIINTSLMTVEQREVVPALPFTYRELERILEHPKTTQYWKWACQMAYWLGLRMVDVAGYEVASIRGESAVLYPRKTGRRLVLPLNDPLIGSDQLKSVFAGILATVEPGQVYCFPERKATYPMYRGHCFSFEFKKLLGHVGIIGKSFHGFRHSFKLRLEESGRSIEEISELMGHADTKVTEGYGRVSA